MAEEKYIELYKKFRPRTLNDVIGQDVAVNQIKKILQSKRIPTALAFFGPPGIGKTTISLIIAKILNCENKIDDVTPCNQCATCKAIDSNTQSGVQYISMANNGSVDDVRRIVSEAGLAKPVNKKVIILDEAHNASSAAFDSLLIPLESESINTLFILGSTDPDKIKPAVLSRVQAITLSPVNYKTLAKHLYSIAKKENIDISKDMLIECAKEANGSVRNAIRNLETVWADGELPSSYTKQIIEALIVGDLVQILIITTEMANNGSNYIKTMEQIYKAFTNALKEKAGVNSGDIRATSIKQELSASLIIQAINILGESFRELNSKVVDSRILFEVPITKLCLLIKKNIQQKKEGE